MENTIGMYHGTRLFTGLGILVMFQHLIVYLMMGSPTSSSFCVVILLPVNMVT
jgi:hypothetical protein